MDLQTVCVHGCKKKYDRTGAVSTPIYQSATFAHPGVGESTGFDYTRSQNPSREHLEEIIAALENGTGAIGFSSGMAAAAAVMELFLPGDHLVVSDDLYGGTYRLFEHISKKNGLRFTAAASLEQMEAAVLPATKAIYIETPTNPTMQVVDIEKTAAIARRYGLLLIVDNTFLTFYFQRPLVLGADLVLHSGTKYLGGHNDTLAGFLVAGSRQLEDRLRFIAKTTGACLAPFDCFLIERGIKTLAVRLEKQQENAARLAEWLCCQQQVERVYYPGLPSHPGHETIRRQAKGFGGMLSFAVKGEALAHRVLNNVKLIQYAESLGGTESLITYPMLQTHGDIPEEERRSKGIDECLLRFSAGLESAEDLIQDIAQAFEAKEDEDEI